MLCSKCKTKEASIHFEGQINNKSIKMDLCESCAKTSGISFPFFDLKLGGHFFSPSLQFPTASPLISQLFQALSQLPKSTITQSVRAGCPKCRWTLEKFQATGRMGCPFCYQHFRTESREILDKIHDTHHYAGSKSPKICPNPKNRTRTLKDSKNQLLKQLEKAIKEERYEDAAKIRDRIRNLDQTTK